MKNIFDMVLDQEAQEWASELDHYYFFLKNSKLDPDTKFKYKFFINCIHAILREIEEIRGVFETMQNEYEQVTFYCNKHENGKMSFFTWLEIVVKNEEGMGLQRKPVNILFNPLIDTTGFEKGGILTLKNGDYTRPYIYEVKMENGFKKLPYIWIDNITAFCELPYFKKRKKDR